MDELKDEINRCLNCKNKPCTQACPLKNDIPAMIQLVKEGKYQKAYDVLSITTVMPFICGIICPKSTQCQGKCTRGIAGRPIEIGKIENRIGEIAVKNSWHVKVENNTPNNKKIAIIGAGPSGISAAITLAKKRMECNSF